MRLSAAALGLLVFTGLLAGCIDIQNPPATQGSPPTVILVERDGSITTLSQAPVMPGPDSDAARAVGSGSNSSSTSTTTSSSATSTGPEPAAPVENNTKPEITGFSASKATGQAPLNVTFRFGARDADGQPLNYTLHFGDGSPAASGKLPPGKDPFHVYTGLGVKKAVLFVGDGQNVTSSTLSITVEAPPAAAPLQYSDETIMPCTGCEGTSTACLSLYLESGLDCVYFELPAVAAGRAFVAWTDADLALYVGGWFREDCDPSPFGLFEDSFGGPTEFLETEVRGTVPAGARCVVLYDDNPMPGGSRLSIDIL